MSLSCGRDLPVIHFGPADACTCMAVCATVCILARVAKRFILDTSLYKDCVSTIVRFLQQMATYCNMLIITCAQFQLVGIVATTDRGKICIS